MAVRTRCTRPNCVQNCVEKGDFPAQKKKAPGAMDDPGARQAVPFFLYVWLRSTCTEREPWSGEDSFVCSSTIPRCLAMAGPNVRYLVLMVTRESGNRIGTIVVNGQVL
jgi:hypothetical protein